MDSRQYSFLYSIKDSEDIPDDFEGSLREERFEAGIFLPQDDSDWFGRVDYPARIVLLEQNALLIASHPSSGEPPVRVPLAELQELEMGRILLIGWLKFYFGSAHCYLPYNTRASTPLEDFLLQLRHKWLTAAVHPDSAGEQDYGEKLDLKFRNLRLRELDRKEDILLQFFESSREIFTRFLFFRLQNWKAGDLVTLTPRSIVWITDRNKGRREFCGGVAHYARLSALRSIGLFCELSHPVLVIGFANSIDWKFPVYEDLLPAARDFLNEVRKLLETTRAPGLTRSGS